MLTAKQQTDIDELISAGFPQSSVDRRRRYYEKINAMSQEEYKKFDEQRKRMGARTLSEAMVGIPLDK